MQPLSSPIGTSAPRSGQTRRPTSRTSADPSRALEARYTPKLVGRLLRAHRDVLIAESNYEEIAALYQV